MKFSVPWKVSNKPDKRSKEHKQKMKERKQKQEYLRFLAHVHSMEPDEVEEYIKLGLIPKPEDDGLSQFPMTTPLPIPDEEWAKRYVSVGRALPVSVGRVMPEQTVSQ